MTVENVKIYDLDESIIASGYPMRTTVGMREVEDKDMRRAINLSKAASEDNSAHGQFLTGIRVAFDLTCTNKMWVEAERYRFLEFISSQSTMHRITKFDLSNQYNEYVDPHIIEIMQEKVKNYNSLIGQRDAYLKENKPNLAAAFTEAINKRYLEILYSNPAGFNLTARLTTNYRCLKNIYKQRHNHRLPEWREFCSWIETLPYAKELLI